MENTKKKTTLRKFLAIEEKQDKSALPIRWKDSWMSVYKQ